jgi:predicted RNase H-like nuclease
LFGLNRILKYKKGKLAERQGELLKLYHLIRDVLPSLEPKLDGIDGLNGSFSERFTGATLKELEDKLDSLICAYIAAYWWYWGIERNWVLGDVSTGYIIVPAPV